ncbi:MAG: redoxin domain-containing protein [Eubacteriales bacterium]|jgi:peroxiredoxin|nr:redoxin domain-containing protein [Eubacteriales bacterium]MDD4682723.1 redoxin domain-containing protein [Eubacteriales bacterium]
MDVIKIGDVAPDFSLEDNKGGEVKLSDFKGKKVLLSWHPLAWTSVCTDQMRALEANYDRFTEANTVPLGLSVDPAASKKVWSAVLSIRETSLLSDFWPHGKVAKDYGIFIEEDGISQRANILVDEEGKIEWFKIYPISELPDIEEVFSVIKKP